MGSEEIYV